VTRPELSALLDVAATQYGIVSQRQLSDLGFSRDRVARLVTSGVLVRVVDGAYRLASHADDELARCIAVCLARPGLVVSGPTAARLHGFRRVTKDSIVHVTAKPHSQPARAPWIRTYRTALVQPSDIAHRSEGIRLTTPARTVVDMVRYCSDAAVISMIEQGVDLGWFDEGQVRSAAERTNTIGRPFARQFLALLDDRMAGGPAGSDWETIVGEALRQRGVRGLVRQYPLKVPGYGRLRFDLAIPERRWALEIDAHPSHHTREGAARDKFRDRCCAEIDWMVQRIGEPDLRLRFDPTIESIIRAIGHRPPIRPAAA
jgi:very-short-patch-repair endonuclease